jgi:hypothetical protein
MLAHQGVDLKRRPPKSRPDRAAEPKQASVIGGGPQGLRRPRFSFFRFTCQTAEGPVKVPLTPPSYPTPRTGRDGGPEPPKSTHPTEPDAVHRVISEGLRRRAVAQAAARQEGLYILRGPRMSTVKRERAGRRRSDCPVRACDTPKSRRGAISQCVRRTAATFLRRSLHNRVGDVAMRGSGSIS